jgi:hypothetical protein
MFAPLHRPFPVVVLLRPPALAEGLVVGLLGIRPPMVARAMKKQMSKVTMSE